MATRYNSYDSRSSSTTSSLASSAEFAIMPSSNAIVKSKPPVLSSSAKTKKDHTSLATLMVKKLMDKNSHKTHPKSAALIGTNNKNVGLVIPADVIAEDLKKASARKGAPFAGLQRKLFGDGKKKEVKALTEVKGSNGNYNPANTRTLAMVLRSERELLGANKELEAEVAKLKSLLEDKNREVEKLKDLCLKQRDEIKSLKSAVLFPEDEMNSQVQGMLARQGKELKHAKQLIPTLQRQVTSLTDQLQSLAEDLAEVKADKLARACILRHSSSPRTQTYDHEQATNSLEFSSCEPASPGSPDDMFLKDLNPCLTPYNTKTKSKEFEEMGYDSPLEECLSDKNLQLGMEFGFDSQLRKLSKSSDCYQSSNMGATARATRRSEDIRGKVGKQKHQMLH